MEELKEIVEAIGKIYGLISDSTSSATLTVIGIILLVIAIFVAFKAVKSKPDEMPPYLRVILFVSLIGGMFFSALGPSLALFYVSNGPIATVPLAKAFDNLENNERVYWLIRLIPFNPAKQPDLTISKLTSLGPKTQRYTFVSPYEELRGYRLDQAVRMIGGTLASGDHVSAIIFQVGSHQLYPGNARGLLQIIRDVEQRMDVSSDRLLISGKANALNAEELTDLDNTAIYSWRWENYRARYPHYCELAQEFRCKAKYAARANIGGLYRDWHPLGLAQDEQQDPCLESTTNYCKADWAALRKALLPHFGSRVFLIENLDLTTIGDRYLIEFGSAGDQVIPDIGFRKK